MLTKDELDLRVGQTLASRTYADLAALTADLPTGLAAAQPPTSVRAPGEQPVLRPGLVIMAASVLYAGVWVYAIFFPKGDAGPVKPQLILGGGLVYLIILAICLGQIAALRREQRSGGQSSRRPSVGGEAPRHPRSTDPGRQLPPAGPGHRHTADATPIVRLRLLPS
jgi:hypothetical protein